MRWLALVGLVMAISAVLHGFLVTRADLFFGGLLAAVPLTIVALRPRRRPAPQRPRRGRRRIRQEPTLALPPPPVPPPAPRPEPVAPREEIVPVRFEVSITRPAAQPPAPISAPPAGTFDLFLKYRDASDVVTDRRVTVFDVERIGGAGGSGALALVTYCHERRAARSFRLDRIVEAIDAETGEVLPEPAADILRRFGMDPEPLPVQRRLYWVDPPVEAEIVFQGRRQGKRRAMGVIRNVRLAGDAVESVTITVSRDPAHPGEARDRRFAFGEDGRDGTLLSLVPPEIGEPVDDIEEWLLALVRPHG